MTTPARAGVGHGWEVKFMHFPWYGKVYVRILASYMRLPICLVHPYIHNLQQLIPDEEAPGLEGHGVLLASEYPYKYTHRYVTNTTHNLNASSLTSSGQRYSRQRVQRGCIIYIYIYTHTHTHTLTHTHTHTQHLQQLKEGEGAPGVGHVHSRPKLEEVEDAPAGENQAAGGEL